MPRPWPATLPSPGAAAVLVLCVLAFGVELGDALGPPAAAATASAPVTLALAPAATPVPTATPTAQPRPKAAKPTGASSSDAGGGSSSVAAVGTATPAPTAAPTSTATPTPTATPAPTATPDPGQPAVRHAFVIWLAGHGAQATYAAGSPAPYLNATLLPQATLLSKYDGLGHGPVADSLALVSGRAPDADSEAGCRTGCAFNDGSVPSLADRLAETGAEARGYQGDDCTQPVARDPLSFFGAECAPLTQLAGDLADAERTPALSFIAPGACDAGVTGACTDGQPDGLPREDAFLARTVPAILASAAYADHGLLLVVFDAPGPAAGDRATALVVSAFARAGAASDTAYDPYAVGRTLADVLGVEPLGQAAKAGVEPFADDVWKAGTR